MSYNFDCMRFSYDQFDELNDSDFYICRMTTDIGNSKLFCLNGIDTSSISFSPRFQSIGTLSFDVLRYIGDGNGELIESNGYEYIADHMIIYADEIGRFIIDEPPTVSVDGDVEKKSVMCHSFEYNLVNQYLDNFIINCGTESSYERLADVNLNEDGSVKADIQYIVGYNESNPQLSLLHFIVDKMPMWSIGYVDGEFANKKYTFNIDRCNVYNFLTQDFCSVTKCFCVFNTKDLTINIVKADELGQDTGLYLTHNSIVQAANVSPMNSAIYNRYIVKGGENCDDIYPYLLGDTKIECYDYYLNDRHMTSEMVAKYIAWRDFRDLPATGDDEYRLSGESYRDAYARIYREQQTALIARNEVKDRVPTADVEKAWDKYELQDLQLQLTYFNFFCSTIEVNQLYYTDDVFDKDKLKELNPSYYARYYEYKTYVIPYIQMAIDNKENSDYKTPTDWITDTELYGIDECLIMMEKYIKIIETIRQYDDFDKMTEEELNEKLNGTQGTLYRENYKKYTEAQEYYKLFYQCWVQRVTEYDEYDLLYNQKTRDLKNVKNLCDRKNEFFGFTEHELHSLEAIAKDTVYENSNFIVTDTSDILDIVNTKKRLYENALEEIYVTSRPQYKLTLDLDNLLGLPQFKGCESGLRLTNFAKYEDNNGDVYDVRIVGFDYNPCDLYGSTFTVTLSDSQALRNGFSDIALLLHGEGGSVSDSTSSNKGNGGLSAEALETVSNLIVELIDKNLSSKTSATNTIVNSLINDELTIGNIVNILTNNGTNNVLYLNNNGELCINYSAMEEDREDISRQVLELVNSSSNLYVGTKEFTTDKWFNLGYYTADGVYEGFNVMTTDTSYGLYQEVECKCGETYTFSAYVKGDGYAELDFKTTLYGNAITDPSHEYLGTVSKEWQRLSCTFTMLADGIIAPRIENVKTYDRGDVTSSKFSIAGINFCRGASSEWTESIDDISSKYLSQQDKELILVEANTEITKTKNSILSSVEEKYATVEDRDEIQQTISSLITQTASDIEMAFTTANQTAVQLNDETVSIIDELRTYIRYNADGIEIGKSDSSFISKFSNTELAFYDGSTKVAYISNNRLYVPQVVEVGQELVIGTDDTTKFSWYIRPENGHLALRVL